MASREDPLAGRRAQTMCESETTGMLELAMGVISTEVYEALLLAHVPEDKAKAAAAEVARTQDIASKSDILELGAQLLAEMDKRFAGVDKRFAGMDERFAGMDKRFAEVEKRFDEMDKRLAEVEKSLAVLKFAVFSGGSIILALLVKLVFFP